MRSFFNMEGPFFVFMNKVADLFILNILFIICCLPVITIGASFTAMSYVTLKMKDGNEGYVWKSFFHSFKQNFRQATLIWLIMLFFAAVLILDFLVMRSQTGGAWILMRYGVIVGAVVWSILFLYVFPTLARFYNSIRRTFSNALLLALANAPKTLLMLLATALAVVATIWSGTTIAYGALVWMMFGFAILSLIYSTLQIGLFRKMSGQPEVNEDEEEKPWVLPDEPEEAGETESLPDLHEENEADKTDPS